MDEHRFSVGVVLSASRVRRGPKRVAAAGQNGTAVNGGMGGLRRGVSSGQWGRSHGTEVGSEAEERRPRGEEAKNILLPPCRATTKKKIRSVRARDRRAQSRSRNRSGSVPGSASRAAVTRARRAARSVPLLPAIPSRSHRQTSRSVAVSLPPSPPPPPSIASYKVSLRYRNPRYARRALLIVFTRAPRERVTPGCRTSRVPSVVRRRRPGTRSQYRHGIAVRSGAGERPTTTTMTMFRPCDQLPPPPTPTPTRHRAV